MTRGYERQLFFVKYWNISSLVNTNDNNEDDEDNSSSKIKPSLVFDDNLLVIFQLYPSSLFR